MEWVGGFTIISATQIHLFIIVVAYMFFLFQIGKMAVTALASGLCVEPKSIITIRFAQLPYTRPTLTIGQGFTVLRIAVENTIKQTTQTVRPLPPSVRNYTIFRSRFLQGITFEHEMLIWYLHQISGYTKIK